MKIYKCDSCGVEIKEPYREEMKEFCFAAEIDEHGMFPKPWKKRTKVHLCKDCFIGLYILEKRKSCEMVHTKDIMVRDDKKYEVIIADDNIFVVCPIVYDEVEQSDIVKYDKAEIYANQESINTLEELGFEKLRFGSKGVRKVAPELNREQIINALEHCTSSTTSEACNGCPLYETDVCTEMENGVQIYALTLIRELIQENERTKLEYEGFKAGLRQIKGEK